MGGGGDRGSTPHQYLVYVFSHDLRIIIDRLSFSDERQLNNMFLKVDPG